MKNIKFNFISLLLGVIIGILLFYLFVTVNKNCWLRSDSQQLMDEIIKTLVRQTSRWSAAALQDKSPLIAVLHANYGAGYLWALKDVATADQIKRVTNIDLLKFEKEITSIQDKVTKNAIHVCPEYNPTNNVYLSKIAGEM